MQLKIVTALALANYLLVLFAGESFHNHGLGPHGQHTHTARCIHSTTEDSHEQPASGSKCACDRPTEVQQVADCLTCKFWAQKTLPPTTVATSVSSPIEFFSVRYCQTPVLADVSIPVIRGPPSIA